MTPYDVKDRSLASRGQARIEWAAEHMPVVRGIHKDFSKKKPLKGMRIAACMHVTSETANLMLAIQAGGAELSLCASNPLSTQDDVASALVHEYGLSVFAIHGADHDTYYRHINQALDIKPILTIDNGADLVSTVHTNRKDLLAAIKGGTGEHYDRRRQVAEYGEGQKLHYPIIAVNDAHTKHHFDDHYGTGQSTIDGIIRATNFLLAGSTVVVAGYGWCGRGIALRARGMGAHIIVTEVDPLKALEAMMDGYQVLPMKEAAKIGHLFITVTGDTSVIRKEHFLLMRHGAIVANAGHFDVEIDLDALERMSRSKKAIRDHLQAFTLNAGKVIYVLAEGRLVNLVAAEGHSASVMDMSIADQALSLDFLVKHHRTLKKDVYPMPEHLDQDVARLKLKAMGITIDELTPAQRKYLASWEFGT